MAPSGRYVVETRMHFDPQNANQEAGLMIYSDDDTNVQNDITWNGTVTMVATLRNALSALPAGAACPLGSPMSGTSVAHLAILCRRRLPDDVGAYLAGISGQSGLLLRPATARARAAAYGGGNMDPSRITVWLRIYRDGNVYTPWYSLDDKDWYRENAWTLASTGRGFPLRIGLFAQDNQNITDPGANAWFDYVHVYRME